MPSWTRRNRAGNANSQLSEVQDGEGQDSMSSCILTAVSTRACFYLFFVFTPFHASIFERRVFAVERHPFSVLNEAPAC